MKLHKSFACRIEITEAIAALVEGPGITPIPTEVLKPRQIKIASPGLDVDARLRWHRDAYVATVTHAMAASLVAAGKAEWCSQGLLTFTVEDYLADPDVKSNHEEVQAVKNSAADLVAVAVIGESRSPLSVCRNIVSGCQDPEKLVEDAKGAVEAASIFLIED
jgi:hypothetical protein